MNSDQIFARLYIANPNPVTELESFNDYTLLIAIMLSAQTTDIQVNKATKLLFRQVQSAKQMLDLGLDGLKYHIKTIGLFNNKASNVIATSQMLYEKYGEAMPRSFAELIAMPGVGRKTANVYLNSANGEARIAVDTHVARLANRLGLSFEKNPNKIERDLMANIPVKWHSLAHHLMILHGRYVCKARRPMCETCPIEDLCPKNIDKNK